MVQPDFFVFRNAVGRNQCEYARIPLITGLLQLQLLKLWGFGHHLGVLFFVREDPRQGKLVLEVAGRESKHNDPFIRDL